MTRRPRPLFAWHKSAQPAVVTAIFTLLSVGPITFFLMFGLLPPFWLGKSEGVIWEFLRAVEITWDVARNAVFDPLNRLVPPLPDFWRAYDWIGQLQETGTWNEYLLRIYVTIAATLWVTAFRSVRRYMRTEAVQGYEHVEGPRLFSGAKAVREMNAELAEEERVAEGGVYIAQDVMLSRGRELQSFAIFGVQGSGKSTILKFLLSQLIGRPETKLVVLDQKGELTRGWPSDSVIFFAPHDVRSHAWDIGADVVIAEEAQEFAAVLVPTEGNESVWPQGARQILEAIIIALQQRHGTDWGFRELLAALQCSPVQLRALVEPVRPEVLTFLGINDDGEFTRTSVGFVVNLQSAAVKLLRPLAMSWGQVSKERRISLKRWFDDKGPDAQTLILQNSTSFPTISMSWMRQVIQSAVRITGDADFPEDDGRRIWFILDEFPQLGTMPDLLTVPETHREKGVTLLLTAQSISQIYTAYSKEQADTLITLLNTQIILRPGQGSDLVGRMNQWLGKVRWRAPADSGMTETGLYRAIPEQEADLITPAYMAKLGKRLRGIDGLLLGIGRDVYRLSWQFQNWPRQRRAKRPANWAKRQR